MNHVGASRQGPTCRDGRRELSASTGSARAVTLRRCTRRDGCELVTTRVSIYLPTLEGGGAERAMVDLANGLRSAGIKTDLAVKRGDGPWRQMLADDVRLTCLKSRFTLTEFLHLLRYLHRARPDVVIATGASSIILTSLAKVVMPRLLFVGRIPTDLTATPARLSLKSRAIKRTQARSLRRADAIVTNSTGSSEGISRSLPEAADRIRTLHNPVVWPNLVDLAKAPVEHPWFRDQVPIIVSAGRLVSAKDHATLIRAFAVLARRREARLIVLGEGVERRNLVKLTHELRIPDRVDLPGFHANPFSFMAKSRLFVLSSTREGMPNVLIQAMACGTPVVSTDCPSGPKEVLEDGKWGPLVPVGDTDALATAMLETIDRPPERSTLVARARAFSVETSVKGYLDLIRDLVTTKHATR